MGGRGGGGSKTPGSRGRPRVVHSMHARRFNTYVAAAVKEPAIFIQRASTHQRERAPVSKSFERRVASHSSRARPAAMGGKPRGKKRRARASPSPSPEPSSDGGTDDEEDADPHQALIVEKALKRRKSGGDLIEGGERAERRRRGRGGRERESEREADADDDDEERVDESGGARGHPRAGAFRGVPEASRRRERARRLPVVARTLTESFSRPAPSRPAHPDAGLGRAARGRELRSPPPPAQPAVLRRRLRAQRDAMLSMRRRRPSRARVLASRGRSARATCAATSTTSRATAAAACASTVLKSGHQSRDCPEPRGVGRETQALCCLRCGGRGHAGDGLRAVVRRVGRRARRVLRVRRVWAPVLRVAGRSRGRARERRGGGGGEAEELLQVRRDGARRRGLRAEVRSISHRSPYDRVGVVNAVP